MRVAFRVTFEADEEVPAAGEVLAVLRDEFDFDGELRVTVEQVPHLRAVGSGPVAAQRENRS